MTKSYKTLIIDIPTTWISHFKNQFSNTFFMHEEFLFENLFMVFIKSTRVLHKCTPCIHDKFMQITKLFTLLLKQQQNIEKHNTLNSRDENLHEICKQI